MRVGRALAAGMVGFGGCLVVMLSAGPALADPPRSSGSVTIDPQSGAPDTLIAVQYHQTSPVAVGCRAGRIITFKWGSHQVAAGVLGFNCVARGSFHPPGDDRKPGLHVVSAVDDSGQTVGKTLFLVIKPDPSGSASPSDSPSASASASPSRTRSAKASPSDSSTDATDPAVPTFDTPTPEGTVEAGGLSTSDTGGGRSSGGSGPSPMGVALAFGGALVLGGVVILGFIVLKGRRYEPELALAESPTQPIPNYGGLFTPAVDPYASFPPTVTEPRPAVPPEAPPPPPIPD